MKTPNRNLTIPLIFSILLLPACNFPLFQTEAQPDEIATLVSGYLTITAEAHNIDQDSTQPGDSNTPNLETVTLTPEGLPAITQTPTLTPSPTPTLNTSDPASLYGNPTWDNPLDSGSSFGLGSEIYSDDYTSIQVTNSAMIMRSITGTGWRGWRLTDRQIRNFYLEGTFRTQNCAGADNYGLVFRAPDFSSGQGYYVSLTCDGRFGFSRWDADGTTFLINWIQNNEILSGSNQTNRLGVMVVGSSYRFYINGVFVQEITDQYFLNDTRIGAYVAGLGSIGFTVELDRIRMWSLQ